MKIPNLSALRSLLVAPLVPYVVAGLVAFVAGAVYTHEQRVIGEERAAVRAAGVQLERLGRRADSLATAYRTDTIVLTRWSVRWDSSRVQYLERILDSLHGLPIAAAAAETVHVSVPLRVLATADTTIRSCRQVVSDCELRHETDSSTIAQLRIQNRNLVRLEPSPADPWIHRAEGFGVALLLQYIQARISH